MPLNIPATVETEPKEVQDFKVKVETIAKRYARKHNLCSVVDEALAEMGVTTVATPISVKIEAMVPVTLVVEMDKTKFAGLTPEEEYALVTKAMEDGNVRVVTGMAGPRRGPGNVTGTPVVTEVSEWTPEPHVIGESVIPAHLTPMFTSDQARVVHLLNTDQAQPAQNGRYAYAVCGVHGYDWRRTSQRNENRVCVKCARYGNVTTRFPLAV